MQGHYAVWNESFQVCCHDKRRVSPDPVVGFETSPLLIHLVKLQKCSLVEDTSLFDQFSFGFLQTAEDINNYLRFAQVILNSLFNIPSNTLSLIVPS